MQKRKVKDRVHLSMHELELPVLVPALYTQKRMLEQRSTQLGNTTASGDARAMDLNVSCVLDREIDRLDRILKQL